MSHPFIDPVSGQACELILPPDGHAGVRHPDCPEVADVSIDLDAFYCRACGLNGRISGAWVAGVLEESGSDG